MSNKPIDFYEYWSEDKSRKDVLYDREKIALKLISKIIKRNDTFLDVGCGNGRFMYFAQRKFSDLKIRLCGVDYSRAEIKTVKKRGLEAHQGDLSKGINFEKNSQDIVYAGEVIEHLYDPDFFLKEINRVLKLGGYFILTTPNLCAWYNRMLILFGIQPLFLESSTQSKLVGADFLKKFKQDAHPVGHVRIFTFGAMKDLLEMNGFKILSVKGSIFDSGLPKFALCVDRMFKINPKLSSNLVIIAQKS